MSEEGSSNEPIETLENDDDPEIGELLDRPHLTADDTEIRVGDEVLFHVRHEAFKHRAQLPKLIGKVVSIRPGYELVFEVWVRQRPGGANWLPQLVQRRDILRVRPSLKELLRSL